MTVESSIVDVTPALALQWLGANRENRNVSKERVRQYADQMRRGQWALTGDAIRFDTDNRLVDGQHRLLAVLEAAGDDVNFTVPMFLITGLAPDTFRVIDTGKARVPGDVLGFGTKGRQRMASMIRLLYVVDTGGDPRLSQELAAVTRVDLAEYHDAQPGLCYAGLTKGGELYTALRGNMTAWGAFCFLVMRATYSTPAAGLPGEFLDGLKYGVGLGAGDARLAYRSFLLNRRDLPNAGHHLHLLIKIWNAWIGGRTLQVATTRADEPWPKVSTSDRRPARSMEVDEEGS